MALHYQESDPIILGSGELYLALANEITNPEDFENFDDTNLINIGAIESGANVNIATEKGEIRSSNRGLITKYSIGKDVRFSTGVMTWNMESMSKFLTGSEYEEDITNGIRKMVISAKDEPPTCYLRFVHEKKDGSGKLIANIYKAQFDGDLNFVFDTENPTTINYEFVGLETDNKNYIEFIETFIPGGGVPEV
ncbi:MAG TPA: hypothetical protein GXX63_02275 [Tissierellia bacterium]|nr:hypothetical protein [Tissierellia bacterium]